MKKEPRTDAESSPDSEPETTTADMLNQMTMQEILKTGEEAANLLNSPVYNEAHRMAMENLTEQWLGTTRQESQVREQLYQAAHGLGLAAQMLAVMVGEAQQINMTDEQRRNAEEQRYLEEQGFPAELN